MIKVFALLSAALGYFIGVLRPGVVIALAFQAYDYESLFGSPAFGMVMNLIPIGLAGLYLFWKKSFSLHIIDGVFFLFVLWFSISVLRAPQVGSAFDSYIKFLILGPGYYFAARTFLRTAKDCNQFARDFLWATIILTLIFGLSAESNQWGNRTAIGEATAVGTSVALNSALCSILFYLIGEKTWRLLPNKQIDTIACIIFAALVLNFIIINGTRGAILGPGVAFIAFSVIFVFARLERSFKLVYVGLALLGVICLPIMMTLVAEAVADLPSTVLAPRFKSAILNLTATITGAEKYTAFDPSTSSRLYLYKVAFEMISEAPIFGFGFEAYKTRMGNYPHNLFLELWTDHGVVSIVIFLWFALWAFWIGLRNALFGPVLAYQRIFFGIALGTFVQMQVSLTITFAKALFFGLGALIAAESLRLLDHRRQRLAALTPPAPTGPKILTTYR